MLDDVHPGVSSSCVEAPVQGGTSVKPGLGHPLRLSPSLPSACVSNSANININRLAICGKKYYSRRSPCIWCNWT
jgi:hypothetical protein